MPSLHLVPPPPPPARLADAEARALALDTTRSFLVEAPAGSGKTALILQRYLKLLTLVESPDQVLAITFTRKATAELHDRVLTQLQNAAANIPPQDDFDTKTRALAEAVLTHDRALQWNLLDNPNRLHIRTIDSLALDIAAGLPVLSGSGGALAPTTEPEPLYAEAAHRTLMELAGPDRQLSEALETILLHRDGNLANCQSHIAKMLELRDQWGELIPIGTALDDHTLDTVVLPKLERALSLAICRRLTKIDHLIPRPILEELCFLASEMAAADGYKGAPSPIALCRDRFQPPAQRAEDLDHWQALIHLIVKPSKPRDFRASLSANHLGFEILKNHQADLKRITAQLSTISGLLEALCSISELPPATYDPDQWLLTKSLFRVLSRALAELQLVFAARGQCDFAELGLLARAALRAGSAIDDLRAGAGMDLQHLLVDEMQDTSTSQYELLHLLTESWDGAGQTVFLVGDPKQSIYRFRQARVERFLETMHTGHLGSGREEDALPLTTLHLTANFRSQRPLVEAFNEDFSLIFPTHPGALQPEQVTYLPATATRPPTGGVPHDHATVGSVIVGVIPPIPAASTWHTTLQPYISDTEAAANLRRRHRKRTAAEIRTLLLQILARPLPPGRTRPWSIVILVRNRIHLTEIVTQLKGSGTKSGCPIHESPIVMSGSTSTSKLCTCPIPFRANEIDLLSERQEILDLISLTRALLHPADRTAWLALLRTPLCGLGLSDLHTLAGEDDPELRHHTILALIDTRGDLLSADGIARLEFFYPLITAALAERGRQPLAQWVHQTWLAFQSNLYESEEARSNIARFFGLLDELEEPGGTLSLTRLEQRMVRLYASPAIRPGAVDLMTIHGAKGLEWDFVLVPGLERLGMNTNGRLFDWIETGAEEDEDTAPGIIAPIRGKGIGAGKLNEWMRSLDKARGAAEVKRLFYVACTRAREELHLFATLELSSKGEQKPRSGSLLAAAWPAAEPHFQTAESVTAPVPHSSRPYRDEWETQTFDLVASAEPRLIRRIPAPPFSLTAPATQASPLRPGFNQQPGRPHGNLTSRAIGNTTHAFLEQLTLNPVPPEALPTWAPRIATLLRSSGLSPTEVQRHTPTILRALTQTLTSDTGQWIIAPHPRADSELALTSFEEDETSSIRLASVRIDRTFLAGPDPLSTGQTHLWIIDYKTATHGPDGLESWLTEQQALYRSQLELYARKFTTHPLRLALYYPLLDRLLWWNPQSP